MDRPSQARPRMKLFVSGMWLPEIQLDDIYNMMNESPLFISLPLAKTWHRQERMEWYIYGRWWTASDNAKHPTSSMSFQQPVVRWSRAVSSLGSTLLVQISRLHQISHPISSELMITMLLEEGPVTCIGVGTVMVRRRRFKFWCMTRPACYLPLPQVAVKAFRFTFTMDGHSEHRPTR